MPGIRPSWYELTSGNEIEQGDILPSFPLFLPPPEFDPQADEVPLQRQRATLIVLSQTCDLVQGRGEKIRNVLLCPVTPLSRINLPSKTDTINGEKRFREWTEKEKKAEWENVRQGGRAAWFMLDKCELTGFEQEHLIADFRDVYTPDIRQVRAHVERLDQRLRLLSPYKEYLSQGLARFFMRVGLPSDIEAFLTKRFPRGDRKGFPVGLLSDIEPFA